MKVLANKNENGAEKMHSDLEFFLQNGKWKHENNPNWFERLKKDIEEKTKKEATKERVFLAAFRICCNEFRKRLEKPEVIDCSKVWSND